MVVVPHHQMSLVNPPSQSPLTLSLQRTRAFHCRQTKFSRRVHTTPHRTVEMGPTHAILKPQCHAIGVTANGSLTCSMTYSQHPWPTPLLLRPRKHIAGPCAHSAPSCWSQGRRASCTACCGPGEIVPSILLDEPTVPSRTVCAGHRRARVLDSALDGAAHYKEVRLPAERSHTPVCTHCVHNPQPSARVVCAPCAGSMQRRGWVVQPMQPQTCGVSNPPSVDARRLPKPHWRHRSVRAVTGRKRTLVWAS